MSCGVGCRRASDPALLWLWCRPSATAPIWPLAWEPSYVEGTTLKRQKDKKKKKSVGGKWTCVWGWGQERPSESLSYRSKRRAWHNLVSRENAFLLVRLDILGRWHNVHVYHRLGFFISHVKSIFLNLEMCIWKRNQYFIANKKRTWDLKAGLCNFRFLLFLLACSAFFPGRALSSKTVRWQLSSSR